MPLHRIALPVVTEWYQEERPLQSDGRSNGTDPRPPQESQSADIGCHGLPGVAQTTYLSGSLCWWLPAVSGYCALSGVNYIHCGRLVFAPQGIPDFAGWLPARAYTRNVSVRYLRSQASPPLP